MEEDGRKRATAAAFGDAAPAYLDSETHRRGGDLDRLAGWCREADRALDVATGAGHVAGALRAVGVEEVIAADAAPEMVATAEQTFDVHGVLADAERLPIESNAVDAVTCRIAAHHFPDPRAFVLEVARVLRPGGTFAFEDNVAPSDVRCRRFLNRLERERDPTHVESYTAERWRDWITAAGFEIVTTATVGKRLVVDDWLDAQSPSPERRHRVKRLLREAPAAATEAFEIEVVDGEPRRWCNPKVLICTSLPGER